MRWLVLLVMVTGCSSKKPSNASSTTLQWDEAVKRETAKPTVTALKPGTANVFELELWLPRGATDESLREDGKRSVLDRIPRKERAAIIADILRGSNPAPPSAQLTIGKEAPEFSDEELELCARYRFAVLSPEIPELQALLGDECRECDAVAPLRLRSFGKPPFDLRELSVERATKGFEPRVQVFIRPLHGRFDAEVPGWPRREWS